MLIEQCNPFIRFASPIQFSGNYRATVSRDHRLFYFLKGHGRFLIDGAVYAVEENTAILFPSGLVYRFCPESRMTVLSINFDYTQEHSAQLRPMSPVAVQEALVEVLERVEFTDYPALNGVIFLPDAAPLLNDLYRLIEELQRQKPLFAAYCSALMKKLLCKAIRHSTLHVSDQEAELEKLLSYIHGHYHEPLDNRLLADRIGYHPYYVNRLMNSYAGTTLHRYLYNYRLTTAANLLLETDDTVENIAGTVGFRDATYFSACFRKRYGLTPTQYRRQHRAMP